MTPINISSLSNQALKWVHEAYEYVKPAAVHTFAPVSCALSLLSSLEHLYPALIYDDEEEDSPSSLIVKTKADLEEVKKLYLSKAFVFDSSVEEQGPFLSAISDVVDHSLLFNYNTIDDLNHSFDMETQLCYSIDDMPAPFLAVGGKRSFSSPLVIVTLPHFQVSSNEVKQIIEQAFMNAKENFNPDEKKFVLAHEFVHIKHGDGIVLSSLRVATSFLNLLAWYSTDYPSWISYLAFGALKAFSVELISEITISLYSRHIENRADKEAMDHLGTNKGALAFFNKISLLPTQGRSHPATQTRILNAKAWTPQSEVA